jgi:hypothetical protein
LCHSVYFLIFSLAAFTSSLASSIVLPSLMKSEKAEEYANFFAKNYSNFEGAAKNE